MIRLTLLLAVAAAASAADAPKLPPFATATPPFAPFVWKSDPPADCPFPRSSDITGIEFTGRNIKYTGADTWYPVEGADGRLYSPWTDGRVGELRADSNSMDAANTGHAIIEGSDPLDLRIREAALVTAPARPYGGRYPCGSLVHDGVWYYGTYCLMDSDGRADKGLNWDILGPLVGFRVSRDGGKTWTETPHTPLKPLFGEPSKPGEPVRFGAPHFVDFGRNMQHSPDGKAYLVAHGALVPDPSPRPANASWIGGDAIYLARVKPAPENINDASKYEFYAGSGKWTRDLAKTQPLVSWNNNAGNVSMTYNAPLKRYLMFVTDGVDTVSRMHTYILESAAITGPWKLVTYMKNFGEQAYFVNMPAKFISADGRTAWLIYSANFTNGYLGTKFASNPPGSEYGMVMQEVRLLK